MSWARNSVGEIGDNIGLPDVTTADNGKIMEVEGGEWKLKEGSGGGGGIPAPASPSDGDVLTYNSTTEKWEAKAPSGGGGSLYIINDDVTTHLLDKTFIEIYTAYTAGNICVIKKYFEGGEDYGAYWTLENIVGIARYLNVQEEGDGGIVSIKDTDYAATADSDYPEAQA